MKSLLAWLGRFNPNGSGIRGCSCCGCHDGCDEHCHEKERRCRIHGVKLPLALVVDVDGLEVDRRWR